jgi:hypothetical protein
LSMSNQISILLLARIQVMFAAGSSLEEVAEAVASYGGGVPNQSSPQPKVETFNEAPDGATLAGIQNGIIKSAPSRLAALSIRELTQALRTFDDAKAEFTSSTNIVAHTFEETGEVFLDPLMDVLTHAASLIEGSDALIAAIEPPKDISADNDAEAHSDVGNVALDTQGSGPSILLKTKEDVEKQVEDAHVATAADNLNEMRRRMEDAITRISTMNTG